LVSMFTDRPLTLRRVAGKLPALALVTPVAVGGTVRRWRRVVERVVRNLRQQSEQRAGDPDRVRVAQRGAGSALIINFGRALGAERKVMRGAQVRGHAQLTVDERRDGLDGQMLGGTEPPRCTDRPLALRGELFGEPGERATEHMSSVGHYRLL